MGEEHGNTEHEHSAACGHQNAMEQGAMERRKFLALAGAAAGLAMVPIASEAWASSHEIVIGGTISQSGPFQGATKPFQEFAEAWAKRINARGGIRLSKLGKSLPVRMVTYDDQTSPPTALKFYERMATVDKVNLFIGPYSSGLTNAALQATATHKIPFFMVEANDSVMFDEPNEWRTTGLTPATWEYKRVAELYQRKGGVKRFALLARDNLHENQAMEGFGDWLKKAGFEVVYQEIAPQATKDFASIIFKMKSAKPDAVFVEALPPPFNIGFLKQARELGLNPTEMIVGHMPVPVIKALGESAENIVSCIYSYEGKTADHKDFFSLCDEVGVKAWQFSELGIRYVALRRIEDALTRAGTTDPEAVRKAMWETNLSMYDGDLVIKHDAKGLATLYPWPAQVQGGAHRSLWPAEAGAGLHRPKNGKW